MSLEDTTKHDLFSRACAGDRDAFESLLCEYRPHLTAFLRSRIGARLGGRLDLEDVLQETLSKVLQAIGTFEYRDDDSFRRWLCSIGEHVILKAVERDRKKPLLTLRHEVEAGRTSPSTGMRRNERFDRLEAAMANLAPDHREVVTMARIQGLAIKEIAARTGRSPAAISMLLSRALRKLKESFGDTESLSLPHDRRLDSQGSGGARDEE